MSVPPRQGIDWPVDSNGKTTQAAKEVWKAVAVAGGNSTLASEIEAEKNWRFNYVPHVSAVCELLANKDREKAVGAAKAGLEKLYYTFVLRKEGGDHPTLLEVSSTAVGTPENAKFSTKKVACEGSDERAEFDGIPYKGQMLVDDNLREQLEKWAEYGTIEPDVSEKILRVIPDLGMLKGRWFVLLGAGSEMGPLRFLLSQGAHVVAVRTKKQEQWNKMVHMVRSMNGSGALYIPVVMAEDGTEICGCDIMTEPLQIRDWICSVLAEHGTSNATNSDFEVAVGSYTYLDSEANVRVSIGCDLIMEGLVGHLGSDRVRICGITSPSKSTPVSREMHEAVTINRAMSPLWMRATGCPSPPSGFVTCSATDENDAEAFYMMHAYSKTQGPNYALAKMIPLWRAMLTKKVSLNDGPPSRTVSVTHNATMAALIEALHHVRPMEVFDPDTASCMLGLLLAHDCILPDDATVQERHPLRKVMGGSLHGGLLRLAFDVESSSILSGVLFVLGKMALASGAGPPEVAIDSKTS